MALQIKTLFPYLVLIVGVYLIYNGSVRLLDGLDYLGIIYPAEFQFISYTGKGLLYIWLGIVAIFTWGLISFLQRLSLTLSLKK